MRRDSSLARESSFFGAFSDGDFMDLALRQAGIAAEKGEVPVGAVVVNSAGVVISSAHNERETLGDPTAHAEILAIRKAAEKTGNWRLPGSVLYVTLEPCMMCMGAVVNSRVGTVVFGAYDKNSGALESGCETQTFGGNRMVGYRGGVMEKECSGALRRFFLDLRKGGHPSGGLSFQKEAVE